MREFTVEEFQMMMRLYSLIFSSCPYPKTQKLWNEVSTLINLEFIRGLPPFDNPSDVLDYIEGIPKIKDLMKGWKYPELAGVYYDQELPDTPDKEQVVDAIVEALKARKSIKFQHINLSRDTDERPN